MQMNEGTWFSQLLSCAQLSSSSSCSILAAMASLCLSSSFKDCAHLPPQDQAYLLLCRGPNGDEYCAMLYNADV